MYFVNIAQLIPLQDEYHCPITSGNPVLSGWEKGARDVMNMARWDGVDDNEEDIVFLTKTGKKPFHYYLFLVA